MSENTLIRRANPHSTDIEKAAAKTARTDKQTDRQTDANAARLQARDEFRVLITGSQL